MEQLVEIGKSAGTPLAYLVIIVFAYKLFDIVANFIKTMSEIVVKFVDKHFTHIDTLEKEVQETSRTYSENTKQFTQALNALNQVVVLLNQSVTQNTQELKPLIQVIGKVESTIRHCEQMAAKRGDKE